MQQITCSCYASAELISIKPLTANLDELALESNMLFTKCWWDLLFEWLFKLLYWYHYIGTTSSFLKKNMYNRDHISCMSKRGVVCFQRIQSEFFVPILPRIRCMLLRCILFITIPLLNDIHTIKYLVIESLNPWFKRKAMIMLIFKTCMFRSSCKCVCC